jgi:hypothetical protein
MLDRINTVLQNADLVLNEQVLGPGGQMGPWDPSALDSDMSHAPWFPAWMLPGSEYGDIADTVWQYLITEYPFLIDLMQSLPGSGGDTPQNRLSVIRFFFNPHIPSRLFDKWYLPGSFKFWASLRQWMMSDGSSYDDIDWETVFPELWKSTDPPGLLFEPLVPGGGGGPYSPGIDYWQDAIPHHDDDGTNPWSWTHQTHGKI